MRESAGKEGIECETGSVEVIVQAKSSVYCTVQPSRSMLLYGLNVVLNMCLKSLTCTASCTTFSPRAIITLAAEQ
jgi:hypothetical protein